MKRKRATAIVLLLLALLSGLLLLNPRAPKVHATFPELLSEAQRTEIPRLIQKEVRRRMLAALRRGHLNMAWQQFRSARSQHIIAVGYQRENTNRIWVYLGDPASVAPGQSASSIIPMTKTQGRWQITNE